MKLNFKWATKNGHEDSTGRYVIKRKVMQTWEIFYNAQIISWHKTENKAKKMCQEIEDIGAEKFINLPPTQRYEIWKKVDKE